MDKTTNNILKEIKLIGILRYFYSFYDRIYTKKEL